MVQRQPRILAEIDEDPFTCAAGVFHGARKNGVGESRHPESPYRHKGNFFLGARRGVDSGEHEREVNEEEQSLGSLQNGFCWHACNFGRVEGELFISGLWRSNVEGRKTRKKKRRHITLYKAYKRVSLWSIEGWKSI